MAKSNDVNRDNLLDLKACDRAVECLHKFRHHRGLLQVVCHVLLYLYYCQYPEKLSTLKDLGALDSRGWVIDMGYDALLKAWTPDDVIRELDSRNNALGGLCSFIFCS